MTYSQIPPNIFLPTDGPVKIRVCKAQNNWFIFKEAPAYKKGVPRSAQPRYESGYVSSTTATHGDAVRVLFSVLIFVQSDTRNRVFS